MKYLLDTNILSNLSKRSPDPALLQWFRLQPSNAFYVSSITMAELRRGVELAQRKHPPAQTARIRAALDTLQQVYAGRIWAFEEIAAHYWGLLAARYPNHPLDAQIAAIALAQDAVLVSNDQDFLPLVGVARDIGAELHLINPMETPAKGIEELKN